MVGNSEINKLNTQIGKIVPETVVELLDKKEIKNLEDIRRKGGIPRLKGIHAKERGKLEAHAYLSLISEDAEVNEKLQVAGFHNIADIALTTRKDFVKDAEKAGIEEDTASLIHAKAAAQSAFLNNILADLRGDLANNFDMPKSLPALPFSQQCDCKECESATSIFAYLVDLTDYTITHVKNPSTSGSMLEFLENRFHQPFSKFPASCEKASKKVRQIRIVIEVLRKYSGNTNQYLPYLLEAYKILLNQFGTSYDEIRMARAADPEKRKKLADRLGISLYHTRPDELDMLFLTEDSPSEAENILNEENLERLFGLVDTTSDPFGLSINVSFTAWRLKYLRTLWKEQDWPVIYPEDMPIIDPDVIHYKYDLRNEAVPYDEKSDIPGLSGPHRLSQVWRIWRDRRKEVDKTLDNMHIILNRISDEKDLESVLRYVFGELPSERFRELYSDLQKGDNIEETRKEITEVYKFSIESFTQLMEITEKAENPLEEVADSEWEEVLAILTQVKKVLEMYPKWIEEEKGEGVILGPDEFWISTEEPELTPWLSRPDIRQKWKQALKMRSQVPYLDPDLICASDLRAHFSLLKEREQAVNEKLRAMRDNYPKEKEGFKKRWINIVWTGWDEFERLAQKREEGKNIEARLDQLSLTTDAFDRLVNLYKLVQSDSILDSEWGEICSIYVQVWKRRLFAAWRDEEKAKDITLIPLLFKIAEEEPDLPQWRTSWEARREWQDKLRARINQKNAVDSAQNEALDVCEEATLPILRDALISDALIMISSVEGDDITDITTKAQLLTDCLLIDCQVGACQKTTRVAQATVTLQSLLFSLRTGQYEGDDLELDAENFDEEWKWIGSYETWKSAILTFLYPEAILLPSLRPRQTPAFRELIESLQQNRRLTPQKVRDLAKEYEAYFKDVCSLTLEAAVQTSVETAGTVRIYIIARGGFTESLYMSYYNPVDPSPDTHTFWEKIPGLEKTQVIDVLGATLYQKEENHYIYLFLKARKEEEKKLAYMKHDIGKGLWDAELTLIDLPEETREFSGVVKQKREEKEPPVLAISSQGALYIRNLESCGSKSDTDEWEKLDPLSIGESVTEVLSFIELEGNPKPFVFIYRLASEEGIITKYKIFGLTLIPMQGTIPMNENDTFRGSFSEKNMASFYVFWGTRDETKYRNILIKGDDIEEGPTFTLYQEEDRMVVRKILCFYPNTEKNTSIEALYQGFPISYEQIYRCELKKELTTSLTVDFAYEHFFSLPRFLKLSFAVADTFEMYITDRLTDAEIDCRKDSWIDSFIASPRASVSVLSCSQEAFYFVPMAIALQLQKAGQYTAALDWYRTVYDYTRPEGDRKIYYGLVLEEKHGDGYERPDNWLLDPLNPHTTAETRRNTYTKFTLSSIIRCLLSYADTEFTRDTFESLPRARILYETALELLKLPVLNQHLNNCEEIIGTLVIEIKDSRWRGVWIEILNDMRRINDVNNLEKTVEKVRTIMKSSEELSIRLAEARKIVDAATKTSERTILSVLEKGEKTIREVHTLLLKDESVERGVKRSAFLIERTHTQRSSIRSTPSEGIAVERLGSEAMSKKPIPVRIRFIRVPYTPTVFSFDFCIPPNPIIKVLRFHVHNNLHKLRTCRNIAGVKRNLELYAVSTTGGMPAIGAGGQLVVPTRIPYPPAPYRYKFLIERASKLADIAAQMEAAFLSALEKRDAEYYNLLKARQDVQLANAGVRLQDLRYYQAQDEVKLADLQRQSAQIQAGHYEKLLREGISDLERASLDQLREARDLQIVSSHTSFAAAALPSSISSGFPSGVSMSYSPQGSMSAIASAISSLAQAYNTESSILSIHANYERRSQEWQFQRDMALQSIRIGDQQKKIAEDGVRIAAQERNIAGMQVEHAEATVEFLATKFTNVELYDWMSGILEGVYSYFLQEATAMAKLAQAQLAFERQEPPPSFIQDDYWEIPSENPMGGATQNAVDRHGLTGSARLMADIYKLDQYRLMTEKRKLQLKRNISLARLAPLEFQRFKETGVLVFNTPMMLFDRDFPGHYLRLIKTVRFSAIALIPAVQSIKATLSNIGVSKVVVNNNGLFQTITVNRPPESVALTSPRDAMGLFELESQSELLLPFEGMGVDTVWELRMPKAANQFEYSTIGDIIITLEYTALESEDYRQQVIETLPSELSGERPFSFTHQFADQWYDLHNPEQTATPLCVRFSTRREDFPPNIEDLKIEHVVMYFARASGESFEIQVTHLRFTEQGSNEFVGGGATSVNGIISTRSGNAGSWTLMIGKSPFGQWELALEDKDDVRDLFKNEQIEDILFVITYSGRTPEWPE